MLESVCVIFIINICVECFEQQCPEKSSKYKSRIISNVKALTIWRWFFCTRKSCSFSNNFWTIKKVYAAHVITSSLGLHKSPRLFAAITDEKCMLLSPVKKTLQYSHLNLLIAEYEVYPATYTRSGQVLSSILFRSSSSITHAFLNDTGMFPNKKSI